MDTGAAWVDLLGYGSEIAKVAHDLDSEPAQEVMRRAFEFQRVLQGFVRPETRTIILNDGALVAADFADGTDSYSGRRWCDGPDAFVDLILSIHHEVNAADTKGARAMVCRGRRVHRGEGVPSPATKHIRNNVIKIKEKNLDPDTETNELFELVSGEAQDPTVLAIPHIQQNMAFSRAFIADELGSTIGLSGRHVYVDSRLLENGTPEGYERIATVRLLGEEVCFLRAP